ncbi:MAG: Peptidyl-prolyl isomerase cwc27 [Ramalina farinacea]|uniref:Peptidyl-prolyl isomerase cwc27 n=1 Tax=Ramalina farinacea TaxID=258253 RepID=A0AA43QJ64_9LECA|nr:Peptidyl-prolyl isomerase cwc27 [Ramalina farinacea]
MVNFNRIQSPSLVGLLLPVLLLHSLTVSANTNLTFYPQASCEGASFNATDSNIARDGLCNHLDATVRSLTVVVLGESKDDGCTALTVIHLVTVYSDIFCSNNSQPASLDGTCTTFDFNPQSYSVDCDSVNGNETIVDESSTSGTSDSGADSETSTASTTPPLPSSPATFSSPQQSAQPTSTSSTTKASTSSPISTMTDDVLMSTTSPPATATIPSSHTASPSPSNTSTNSTSNSNKGLTRNEEIVLSTILPSLAVIVAVIAAVDAARRQYISKSSVNGRRVRSVAASGLSNFVPRMRRRNAAISLPIAIGSQLGQASSMKRLYERATRLLGTSPTRKEPVRPLLSQAHEMTNDHPLPTAIADVESSFMSDITSDDLTADLIIPAVGPLQRKRKYWQLQPSQGSSAMRKETAPDYKVRQSTKVRSQQKGIHWLTVPAKSRFEACRETLWARWGVKPSFTGTCVLLPESWKDLEPLHLIVPILQSLSLIRPSFIVPSSFVIGGELVYPGGAPFEDEFHSRLKFNRRDLLGMANEGSTESNGSQFFLTLGETRELEGRNTLFGRVVGDTVYNLMKMGEAELQPGEGSERPVYATRITGAEILVNPFEDMVVREVKEGIPDWVRRLDIHK